MNKIVIRKVKVLQGIEKWIAENQGLDPDDLVIVSVSLEMVIGDPVSYLLAQIEDDDGEAPERCDLSCPHVVKCYAYHEGELCEFQSSETSTSEKA